MINKKLDAILCDYVEKASKFCKSYVEEVLGKNYSPFPDTLCNIYRDFEDELWRLENDAKMAMYVEVDKATITGEDISDVKSFEGDLFTMHKYYRNMYSAKIASGLAKSWTKAGNNAFWDLTVNAMKNYVNKGGHKV